MNEGIRKQPNSSQLQGCLAGTGKCPGPRRSRCGRGQGQLQLCSPDLPSEPSCPAVPSTTGAARSRAWGMAAAWARLWRVQTGDSQSADLGLRCTLPAEGTELLSCSSIQVKILPADTSTVCSAFRFVQENQLQQITQEAISS